MATILFCWELGGGLGHVAPYLKLADELVRRDHRIEFALRETAATGRLLRQHGYSYMQAPIPVGRRPGIRLPCTYAHVLYNSGYDDAASLLGLIRAWRALFRAVRPDLLIGEHAPTALLASLGLPFKRVTIGNGFALPPDAYPLPNLRSWLSTDIERLRKEENIVCETTNRVLAALKAPMLDHIGALFRTNGNFLRAIQEVDPYERPKPAEYWGTPLTTTGHNPEWPNGRGPRVFAYLKPSSLVVPLFKKLAQLGAPTLAVSSGLPKSVEDRYSSETLRFSPPVNMREAVEQCDVAIHNSNLNSAVQMLLAGKPMLLMPLTLEHYLTARKVESLGIGVDISQLRGTEFDNTIERFFSTRSYGDAAAAFAKRYDGFDPDALQEKLAAKLAELLT